MMSPGTKSSPIMQWRKFEFFDVQEGVDNGALGNLIKAGSDATCLCSGRGLLFIGDSGGFVHSLTRSFHSPVPSYPAHDAPIAWMWASDSLSVLVSLAHLTGGGSEIKVWAPDRLHADQPMLLRVLRPDPRPPQPRSSPSVQPFPLVTAVAVHDNLHLLVVCFKTGAIMLYRGDLTKERDSSTTSRVVVTLPSSISAAHFYMDTQTISAVSRGRKSGGTPSVSVQTVNLLVTTDTHVYSVACTHRDKETAREVDRVGCARDCVALADGRSDHFLFVMAREEALYTYNPEGRASCYVFPGDKLSVHCYRSYAIVVSSQPGVASRLVCTLYDLQNKVIAASVTLPGALLGCAAEWGALYALCNVSQRPMLVLFKERDLHTKMEILFKKNQYDIAVSLAKGQNVSSEGVAEILKQYGDWLYSKGEYAMAAKQYTKTIPYLEPSYVIKKFLSSEHMPLLAQYLEALMERNLHTPDHSALLLNCYTRTQRQRIDAFLQRHTEQVLSARRVDQATVESVSSSTARRFNRSMSASNRPFTTSDVEVHVAVCRENGFHEHALQLTQLHALHSLHLDILCNDTKEFERAVRYIRGLPFPEARDEAVALGSALVKGCPELTLELLIDLATDYTPDNTPLIGEAPLDCYLVSRESEFAPAETFESVVCGDSLLAIRYVEGVCRRLAELGRPRPAPRLTAMLLSEYLHQRTCSSDAVTREAWEGKVQHLLSGDSEYPVDPALACLLCDRHHFPQGKLVIWQHRGMYSDILQYHMSVGDETAVMTSCELYGDHDPSLWVTALRLVTAPFRETLPDTRVLHTILDHIDSGALLPPMEVVSLLCACPHVTVEQAGRYLATLADREEAAADQLHNLVTDSICKSDTLREQIREIMDTGLVFSESKCDACHKDLEFPTVHFFCKHSFHQHCFVSYCSSEDECPMCLPAHNEIRDALKTQVSERAAIISFGNSEEQDVFHELSNYLARGLFTDYSSLLSSVNTTPRMATGKGEADHQSTDNNVQQGSLAAAARLNRTSAAALHSSVTTESRLRLNEARQVGPLPSPTSEGRLRQEAVREEVASSAVESRLRVQEARTAVAPRGGEGRLRTGEGRSRGSAVVTEESRLRQEKSSSVLPRCSEGRVRGDVASSVTATPAEARIRTQTRRFGGQGLAPSPSSLHEHITLTPPKIEAHSRVPQVTEVFSSAVVNSKSLEKGSSKVVDPNPFEGESNNPFGEDFEALDTSNPFADEKSSPFDEENNKFQPEEDATNPFVDSKNDYDERLNPFGEDS